MTETEKDLPPDELELEIVAMTTCLRTLRKLSRPVRTRVIRWLDQRLEEESRKPLPAARFDV